MIMDRKKFVTLISTGFIGAFLLKTSLLKNLLPKNKSDQKNPIKVNINPNAVYREKPGKRNG